MIVSDPTQKQALFISEHTFLTVSVIEIRRNARAQGVVIEKDPISTNDRGLGANPIRVNNPLAARTTGNKSINERRMEETIRTEKYLSSYKRLEELSTKLNKDGQATCHILMNEFVRIANPMVEGFRQTTALFPCALVRTIRYVLHYCRTVT